MLWDEGGVNVQHTLVQLHRTHALDVGISIPILIVQITVIFYHYSSKAECDQPLYLWLIAVTFISLGDALLVWIKRKYKFLAAFSSTNYISVWNAANLPFRLKLLADFYGLVKRARRRYVGEGTLWTQKPMPDMAFNESSCFRHFSETSAALRSSLFQTSRALSACNFFWYFLGFRWTYSTDTCVSSC